jgi:hypothetical protein
MRIGLHKNSCISRQNLRETRKLNPESFRGFEDHLAELGFCKEIQEDFMGALTFFAYFLALRQESKSV